MSFSDEKNRTVLLTVLAGLCESSDEHVKQTADRLRIKLISGTTQLSETEKNEILDLVDVKMILELDGGEAILEALKCSN